MSPGIFKAKIPMRDRLRYFWYSLIVLFGLPGSFQWAIRQMREEHEVEVELYPTDPRGWQRYRFKSGEIQIMGRNDMGGKAWFIKPEVTILHYTASNWRRIVYISPDD